MKSAEAGFFNASLYVGLSYKDMIIPIIFFIASATFGAPTALSNSAEMEIVEDHETLSAYVEQYYVQNSVLADIAWCESRTRHLDKEGNIVRGTVDPDDIGVMQINTRYHEKKAEELGLDLYSLNGNLAYAQYLYDRQGVKPWLASASCWGRLAKK